jgi:hypothetical protein
MAPNVNKPTDIKQKEADVNRKLQIYGIISAFKTGKVPSVRASFLAFVTGDTLM